MSPLVPCPHCRRHHRVGEAACPFCGGALPAPKSAPARGPLVRMSRAMLLTAGAALLGAAACESNFAAPYGAPPPPPPVQDAGNDGADAGSGGADADAGTDRNPSADASDGGEG